MCISTTNVKFGEKLASVCSLRIEWHGLQVSQSILVGHHIAMPIDCAHYVLCTEVDRVKKKWDDSKFLEQNRDCPGTV